MDFKVSKIIRSKRKSFCIEINDSGEILLRVPLKAKENEIESFVRKHKRWIEKKLSLIKNREIKFIDKKFIEDENFLFLGKFYSLKIIENQKKSLVFDNGFFLSKKYQIKAKDVFKNFYKKMAKEILLERVSYYSKIYEFKYNKIKINSANKRWGSCTAKGNLNFSFRLVMAPLDVIDYIVVHELVHLIDKTHSKCFYEKISKILPDYKKSIEWLNKYHYLLKI